jgi:hypothetical protein
MSYTEKNLDESVISNFFDDTIKKCIFSQKLSISKERKEQSCFLIN